MKRFRLLCVLVLTATLGASLLGATDQPIALEEPTALEQSADQPSVLPAQTVDHAESTGCSTSPVPQIAWASFGAFDQDVSSLKCNCNSNADCKRICGNENATCFIGPLCDNFPTYTGRCKCGGATPVEVTN